MAHTFHRYRVGDEPVAGYRLVEHLGAGGFGEVWKANAPGGTEVAIKIIDLTGQQGVQEFASLRVVKKVRHPNLISLQAFWMKDEEGKIVDETGEAAPNPLTTTAPAPDSHRQSQSAGLAATAYFTRPVELIIAMQLGAMSLYKRLEDCRSQGQVGIPVAELLEYLDQAARGIDFLNKPIHDLGNGPVPIVHGDIKPHNILVVGDAAVICDFGLARAVETLRKTSMAPVTVAYAAPESFKGKVAPTSDQYSLAVTYVELRTGRLPFDETLTPYQVMEAHVMRALDFSRLPEPERQVVLRATDPEPENRWVTSRDMVLALRQAVAQTGELPLRPGEIAFSGGPTPTHALTQRPMGRDTDRPTQFRADPHGETSLPRGVTPSHLLAQQTAASPPGRASDGLVETSLLPPEGAVEPARSQRKSRLPAVIGGTAVVAAGVLAYFMLGGAPSEPPGAVVASPAAPEPAPIDPATQYIKSVQDEINAGEFAAAVDLLGKPYSKVPAFEIEALQSRLKQAFLTRLETQVESRNYSLALVQLEDALRGIGLTDEEKSAEREKIRTAWLDQAQTEFDNGQPSRAAETASHLLRRFPGDREAALLAARSQLRLENDEAAGEALKQLGELDQLPAEYQPLAAALHLLVQGADEDADPTKLLDGFIELVELAEVAPPAPLSINSWEEGRLSSLRSQTIDAIEKMLKTVPPDQARALVDKLEQLGSNAELQLYKVKSLIADKQFAEARKVLDALAVPNDASGLQADLAVQRILLDLRDPSTKLDRLKVAMGNALAALSEASRTARGELAAAAEELGLSRQDELLSPSIAVVAKASSLDPLDQALAARWARLLAASLTAQAESGLPSQPAEIDQLVKQCRQVEAAELRSAITDALLAECLLAQGSRDRDRMLKLVKSAPADNAYLALIKARVLATSPTADWDEIGNLLAGAYANGDSAPAVRVAARRLAAAELLVEAAGRKRTGPIQTAAAAMANPFGTPQVADQAFDWLRLAQTLSQDGADDAVLSANSQQALNAKLALAAAWKTKPDFAVVNQLSPSILKRSDSELAGDSLELLLAVFRAGSHAASQPDGPLEAARRFTELFQEQFPIADDEAVDVYRQIIEPALKLGDERGGAQQPVNDLDRIYAAAADFIGHYKRATWPFDDKFAEQESLLSKAIAINPRDPSYFTQRGTARVSQTPPKLDGALADAEAAKKLNPKLPAALGLESHALIYRSRGRPTREEKLADLDKAVARSLDALANSSPDDKQHGTHLLYASMAHLERANFDTDRAAQRKLLTKARQKAQQAVDFEKAYPDYAYVALGNALEDLAWLTAVEPEANYLAAIDAFSRAIETNPSAPDAWVGRARCYYKALADSKLNPQFLGTTKEDAMRTAIADLEQARELRPNMIEPNLWIGRAQQQLGDFVEADAAFSRAVELAIEQELPERTIYLAEWTRNAATNSNLSAADRAKAVRERAEKLKAAPSIGGSSGEKQAAVLVGQQLMAEKKFAEAIKGYDAALAEYDELDPKQPLDPTAADGSDAALFLARAACRFAVPETQWNATAAGQVIQDAQRVLQLKPDPRLASLAHMQAARARSRSMLSSSTTFTPEQKQAFLDQAIADIRHAIAESPSDPSSWEWRAMGAKFIGVKLARAAAADEAVTKLAIEARAWIDEAIAMAASRPDLRDTLAQLQRTQRELDATPVLKAIPRK